MFIPVLRLAVGIAVTACFGLAQFSLVAPAGYATVEGGTNNVYPWNRAASSMRYQQFYDSSNFTSQGVAGPVLISRLRFRANATTASWAGGSWPNVQIDMSTSAVDYLAFSSTFAANHGADLRTVHNGQVTVQPGTGNGTATPGPWYIDIPLTTPFVYDPSTGNDLCLDVMLDGTGWSGAGAAEDTVTSSGVPPPLGSRLYNSSAHNATTASGSSSNYCMVTEFTYVPAAGLYPAFTATPTSGPSPLQVQFTDGSYSSDPGGVLAWQWDLDGDTVIDSSLQHPTFTYATCGSFSVSLTVVDATHGLQTVSKPNFIVTDPLQVSFRMQELGNGQFQFTDTSAPTPQVWMWDFDGDNVVDSVQQHPLWVYPADCAPNQITLTAVLNCRTGTATARAFVAPASATTQLSGGTGTTSSTGVGNIFDIVVNAQDGISVCGFTTISYTGTGPFRTDVYLTDGSYVGKDTNLAAWRLVATGTGVMGGGTTTAPAVNTVALSSQFYLPAGRYGIALVNYAQGGAAYVGYTNAATGPFGNADLTICPSPTTAPSIARTALFGGTLNTPRLWNGTFHYTKVSLSNTGGYGFFAPGCAGTLPASRLVANAAPRLGTPLVVTADNVPQLAAIGLLGFSNTSSLFGPLPFDLALLGAPGCAGRVSPDGQLVLLGTANSVSWTLPLPNLPPLLGVRAYQQLLLLDGQANALGAVTSDAAGFVIGQ